MTNDRQITSETDDEDDEACSVCGTTGGVESTFCGSFCGSCLSDHLTECAVCRADAGLGSFDDEDEDEDEEAHHDGC